MGVNSLVELSEFDSECGANCDVCRKFTAVNFLSVAPRRLSLRFRLDAVALHGVTA